jgi:hypothetical protein
MEENIMEVMLKIKSTDSENSNGLMAENIEVNGKTGNR